MIDLYTWRVIFKKEKLKIKNVSNMHVSYYFLFKPTIAAFLKKYILLHSCILSKRNVRIIIIQKLFY